MRTRSPSSIARAAAVALAAAAAAPASAGVPDHVFLISVDGLRSDLVDRVETPNIDLLIRSGCRALAARSVRPAVTLPAHASMLSGLTPRRHGFLFNRATPAKGRLPHPTLLSVLADRGEPVAAFVGKKKLVQLLPPPGTFVGGHAGYHDKPVVDRLLKTLKAPLPRLTFLHLPDVDAAGHAHGWGTPEQLAAVVAADAQIGRVLRAVHKAGVLKRTAVIVTADHGGHGKAHGLHHPKEFQVEFIAAGLGFHPGRRVDAPVSLLDIAPTVLAVLEQPGIPGGGDGRVVTEALYLGDRPVDAELPTQIGARPPPGGPSGRSSAGVPPDRPPRVAPSPFAPAGAGAPASRASRRAARASRVTRIRRVGLPGAAL